MLLQVVGFVRGIFTQLQDCYCNGIWDKTVFQGLVREVLSLRCQGRSSRKAKVKVGEVGPPTSWGGGKVLDQIRSVLLVKFYP